MIELQSLDCNCSDCKHLTRSISRRQESVDLHYKWQKEAFDLARMRIIKSAEEWISKGEPVKAKSLLKEARKMSFQFDESECAIHYGDCSKFEKKVSFIPETIQVETQDCFKHRKS